MSLEHSIGGFGDCFSLISSLGFLAAIRCLGADYFISSSVYLACGGLSLSGKCSVFALAAVDANVVVSAPINRVKAEAAVNKEVCS